MFEDRFVPAADDDLGHEELTREDSRARHKHKKHKKHKSRDRSRSRGKASSEQRGDEKPSARHRSSPELEDGEVLEDGEIVDGSGGEAQPRLPADDGAGLTAATVNGKHRSPEEGSADHEEAAPARHR